MSDIRNSSSPRRGTVTYPTGVKQTNLKGTAALSRETRAALPLQDPRRNRAGPPRREDAVAVQNYRRQSSEQETRREERRTIANLGTEDIRFGFGGEGGGGGGGGGVGELPCTDCAEKAAGKSDSTLLYVLAALFLLGGV